MPSNGLHPFLQSNLSIATVKNARVNALKRATSISTQDSLTVEDLEDAMCQCPQTGYIHFYTKDGYLIAWNGYVSMPSNGLHPFLQKFRYGRTTISIRVNALKRATSISTKKKNALRNLKQCVNALKRATSISTDKEEEKPAEHSDVSMPSTGLHPFLLHGILILMMTEMVSMPSNGLHPFLLTMQKKPLR